MMAGGPESAPLPPELAARVESELSPGERLVWSGQPLESRYACLSIPMAIVGLFFVGFSVLWLVMTGFGAEAAREAGAGGGGWAVFGCFPLCGVPFGLIGLGLLASPWWMRRMARATCYAVTDRRAIILEPSLFGYRQVRSFEPSGLGQMTRLERPDGSGDLVFQSYRTRDSEGNYSTTRVGFLALPNVRAVEDLIRRTLLSG